MLRAVVVLFAVAACLLVATTLVSALHEDEAGKYDWLLKRIGTPVHGTMLVTSGRKTAYLATGVGANTIAAVKMSNGTLLWRRVLGSDEELAGIAVAAHDANGDTSMVAAATKAGVVHFLRGRDGVPLASPLSLRSEGLREVLAVLASGTEEGPLFHVVGPTKDDKELSVFTVDPVKSFEATPAFHLPVPAPVAGVALGTSPKATATHDAQEMLVLLQDGRSSWVRLKAGGVMRPFAKQGAADVVLTASGAKLARAVATNAGVALSSVAGNDGVTVTGTAVGEALGKAPASASVECSAAGAVSVAGAAVAGIACDSKRGGVDLLAWHSGAGAGAAASSSTRALFTTRHDGAVHFVAVAAGGAVTAQWTRHEGIAFPIDVALEHEKRAPAVNAVSGKKNFAIATSVFVLSRYGVLYRVDANGKDVSWATDLGCGAIQATGSSASTRNDAGAVVVRAVSAADSKQVRDFIVDAETGKIIGGAADGNNKEAAAAGRRNLFDIDRATGELVGYELSGASRVDIWRARVPGKISAVAAGHEPLAISSVEHYKPVPNRTSSTTEIRRRYPMANVIVLAAHDAADALTVVAVDALTGATLHSARHADSPAPVRLVVAEHTVIYTFYSRAKRRHYVAVWELFEHQAQVTLESNMVSPALVATSLVAKRRQFHSGTVRAPHVVASLRFFPHGPVAVLGVSHTAQAIARKLVVFVLASGEALSIALPQLWGVPLKQPDPKTDQEALMWNSVAIGSYDRLTHTNRVMSPTLFRCAPTLLESTSRIVVAGLDLWYYPASAGKPFDRLDDEFNKRGLLMVCVALPIATLVLRWFAIRRTVNAAWK